MTTDTETTTVDPIDIIEILSMLPHRYPLLIVDRVKDLVIDTSATGIKNVTMNEPQFQGHFPGNPVFPGVLQLEALAQTGGILALSTVPDPENWDTYFIKIDSTLTNPSLTSKAKKNLLFAIEFRFIRRSKLLNFISNNRCRRHIF